MTPYTLHWAPHVTSPIEWVICVLEVRLRGNMLFGHTKSRRPQKVVKTVPCGINLCFIISESQWYIHWRSALILARLTQLKMVIKRTLQWQRPWVTYIYESWHNLIRSLSSLYEAAFQRVGNVWHINLFLKLIWLGLPRLWHCVLNRHNTIKSDKSHLFHINLFVVTSHVHNERQEIFDGHVISICIMLSSPAHREISLVHNCTYMKMYYNLNWYKMQYFFDPLK